MPTLNNFLTSSMGSIPELTGGLLGTDRLYISRLISTDSQVDPGSQKLYYVKYSDLTSASSFRARSSYSRIFDNSGNTWRVPDSLNRTISSFYRLAILYSNGVTSGNNRSIGVYSIDCEDLKLIKTTLSGHGEARLVELSSGALTITNFSNDDKSITLGDMSSIVIGVYGVDCIVEPAS